KVLNDAGVDDVLRRNLDELELVGKNIDEIKKAGGYKAWKISNAGGGLRNTIKYVDNYKVTSTGRIAEFVSESGDVLGTLFKQSKNGKVSYSFKYKTSSGNVKTLNKLEAEIYDDFIEFDFNVPSELKGQGISSVVFDDAIKYYDAKNLPYKGIRGRWEGADPKYTDGISDNFKAYKEARKANKTETEAAFETWTGKQANKAGFTKATVTTDDDILILVEFIK
ncbi:hypothetical protein, partial [Aquimarina addita]|uniref:hypothetical protein n=1 Tax=Aquimarina addita TaxID=870485 RepID=UPI0031E733E2